MPKTNDAALAVLAPSGPAGYQEIVREFPFRSREKRASSQVLLVTCGVTKSMLILVEDTEEKVRAQARLEREVSDALENKDLGTSVSGAETPITQSVRQAKGSSGSRSVA